MRSRLSALPASAALLLFAAPAEALPPPMRVVSLCTKEGVRSVAVPMEDKAPIPAGDCAKACHMACERKKARRGGG